MSRGLVKTSRYSPGNMTGQALEQLFVGRDPLMKKVLKRITASALGAEKHFTLLVGPRGMGKTHFVSLAHHKLRTDASYAEARSRLKVAYLNEEEWGVASFLDLLVRILRALVAEQKDSKLAEGINRIYQSFTKGPDAAREAAESLLIDYVRDSTLLVVCENLFDLFEGLDEEGQQRWRAFIQEHPFWTILATTPALFAGVQLQHSPFYGFFTIEVLKKLDFDTAMELLRQRAVMDGQQRLTEFLQTPTGRARVRAIHHLAGGNHRVYVILSDFLDKESLEDLVTPFMRMADDLTPYYQDRMRQLSSQQRKIIELLCQESKPIIVKDVALKCLISQQVAAKQLSELAKNRFVLNTKVGREAYYELAEPLMRICVDIKDNRTEHFKLFVDFLRYWFSGRELRTKFELLAQSTHDLRRIDKIHLSAAIQGLSLDDREPFLEHLDAEALRCYEEDDNQGLLDALPRLIQERPSAIYYDVLSTALFNLEKIDDAFAVLQSGIAKFPTEHMLHDKMAALYSRKEHYEDALRASESAIALQPNNASYLCAHAARLLMHGDHDLALDFGRSAVEKAPEIRNFRLVLAEILRAMGRTSEAEHEYRQCLVISPDDTESFQGLFTTLVLQDKNEEALKLLDSSPAMVTASGFSLTMHGRALAALGRYDEAIRQLDEAIRIDKTDQAARIFRTFSLFALGRSNEAFESLKGELQSGLAPENAALILEFLIKLGAASKVLSFIEENDKSAANRPFYVSQQAQALVALGRHKEAQVIIRQAQQVSDANTTLVFVEIEAITGSEGFGAGLLALGQALLSFTAHDETALEALTELLSNMLDIEHRIRGPIAMARQIAQLGLVLDKHGRANLLPAALTRLLEECLKKKHFATDEWPKACLLLQESLAERPDCRIPVAMLSVAARYAQNADKSILLELPLEQRTLLMEKLGVEQA